MPSDQEWLAELPQEQSQSSTPETQTTATAGNQAADPYAGQIAEIYSGKNTYKLPFSAEIPFKQQGKIATQPIGKLINAYNQHLVIQPKYDATLKELNSMRPEFEKLKGRESRFAELEALQGWTEKNPEIFKKLWDSYNNREKLALEQQLNADQTQQPTAANQQLLDVIAGLKGELGELKTWKGSWEQEQKQKQQEQNVKLIEDEITNFKKAYPFLDLDKVDEGGVSLVEQIIKHGIDKSYPTFKVAALEYLEPQLLERLVEKGRSEAVKGIKDQTKKGIIATSSAPFPINGQVPQAADAKKSDSTLLSEAKALLEQYQQSSV